MSGALNPTYYTHMCHSALIRSGVTRLRTWIRWDTGRQVRGFPLRVGSGFGHCIFSSTVIMQGLGLTPNLLVGLVTRDTMHEVPDQAPHHFMSGTLCSNTTRMCWGEGKAVNREPIAKWALFSISCMIATLLPLLANDGFVVMKHVRVCPCSQCSHVFV